LFTFELLDYRVFKGLLALPSEVLTKEGPAVLLCQPKPWRRLAVRRKAVEALEDIKAVEAVEARNAYGHLVIWPADVISSH
jgi:hypothetical protein